MQLQTSLVATFGGQPQIITFTLDLLLAEGKLVDEVIVVYLASSSRYQESFRKLAGEFPGECYQGQSIHLRPMPIRWNGRLLEFVRQPHEVEAVRRSFFDLFRELKARGQRIFLSVTGGRRMLSLLAMSTAMRHFTTEDRLYHLYTPAEIRDQAANGALMHVPPGSGVHLIEVPLVPWGIYLPGLAPLLGESPSAVRAAWQDESERERCQQVWAAITPRQRDALRELALGRSRQQAAERLGVSVTTVDTHKTEVFNQCRMAWMDADLKFDTHFLRERFKPFLVGLGEV